MDSIKNYFKNLKSGTEYLNYGRDIICEYAIKSLYINKTKNIKILDLGAGLGTDLINVKNKIEYNYKKLKINNFNIELNGIETFEPNLKKLQENNINGLKCNIENEALPFKDNSIDIIILNQVIEHTKEIFWIFSEISRILKQKGVCIVGVPNLASLHNRIILLMGGQPTSIEILGPHVRGITKKSFIKFIETDNLFKVKYVKGSNFYPFRPNVSKVLSKYFPNLSVSLFFYIERTNKIGNFINILNTNPFETPYYRGGEKKIIRLLKGNIFKIFPFFLYFF